jgi:meso-butanediol dehydrogenase/(S,S)-butanediol dehydrogenase/diacetyl reductase
MAMLQGKAAFVTGAGSGIGQGIAERLARDGADVAIADIDLEGCEETAERVRKAGGRPHVVQANVASQRQLQAAVESSASAFGRLDIAVANAGIARAASVLEMPLEDWQELLDVNLTGVFLTVQTTARKMVEFGHGGRIVCMASLAAVTVGPMTWAYSATKAGVAMLARGWAQELGPHGITVNAVGPGIIETPLARPLAGDEGGAIRKAVEEVTPLGRVGKPGDVAGVVSFLCGPDAAYMTGSYLLLDGGLRDAPRPARVPDAGDPRAQEFARHLVEAVQRRQKQKALLHER